MSSISNAQLAIAQLAERFTPELKRHIMLFAAASFAIALLALVVLFLIGATYEPLTWTVLVCTGAAYGWYARGELTLPNTVAYIYDEEEDE